MVNPDYRDLLSAFNAHGVEFMVVGAHALAAHGHVRATRDLDVWVRPDPTNARRVMAALGEFGAPLQDLAAEDLMPAGRHRALGGPALRINRGALRDWSLSEPVPGSWWTVQRLGGHARAAPGGPARVESGADGSFEDVARVRAGEDSYLSWVDDSPPGGLLRYRIRRDCVDKHYEWLSDEATWPPQVRKPRAVRLAARDAGVGNELELEGAAPGALDVRVYDVQGRLVHRQSEMATEGETKVFRLGLGVQGATLRSGIYFIRVRDALGQESNAVKTVLLR